MPKNDKEELNNNAEAAQAPASYTPPADTSSSVSATSMENAPRKRGLGTGAIVGIAAAGVVLLAGVFGGGYAVAQAVEGKPHGNWGTHAEMSGEGASGMPGPMKGDRDGDGDGPRAHHGPRPGGQMDGDQDGPMPGNMPHQHDANGQDIVPEGTATTTPAPATTN